MKRKVNCGKKNSDKQLMFDQTMVRNSTQYFSPSIADAKLKKIPYIIRCIHYLKDGKETFFSTKESDFNEKCFNIQDCKKIDDNTLEEIARFYEVKINIFHEKIIIGGRKIDLLNSYGKDGDEKIGLIRSAKNLSYYIAILPTLDGTISFIEDKVFCQCCAKYINHNGKWKDHLKLCMKCKCGRRFEKGKPHECDMLHYKDDKAEKYKGRAKRYYVDKSKKDPNTNYFCDLETLIKKNGLYKTYAGGYTDSLQEVDNTKIFIGEDSLDLMMNSIIENCDGILWFFNGSRFDNFFLLNWLLRNKIQIVPNTSVIVGNNIITITFETKNGKVTIKDLSRFLPGSLDDNCKAFGLPEDKSKTSMDHDKFSNFEKVEKYKEEVKEYLYHDINSLKEIFRLFSKEMYSMYKLHPSKYLTNSHFAYAAFTSKLKGKGTTLFKTPKEDEDIMRELYKGGRVICGRPIWKSSFSNRVEEEAVKVKKTIKVYDNVLSEVVETTISQELYDMIDDYAVYADANSLYPAAQVNRKYPTGKHTRTTFIHGSREEKIEIASINERKKNYKDKIYISGYCVDVTCPKDISVAFLMVKSEEGEVEQNLIDKKRKWFTGPELWEASKIGYVITRVHEKIHWWSSCEIFNEFVNKTYKMKCEAERDTPRYICAKNLLNSLTGKFGQHMACERIHLILEDDEIAEDIKDITEIFDNETSQLLGWYAKSDVISDYAPFPIHLSSFILGWSRVYMSKMMRRMGLYRIVDDCPLYGDTDSLIALYRAWLRLDDKWKGDNKLGQMKLEIPGKIISVIVLSPKTYCLTYINAKDLKILSITKSKGIPHNTKPYNTYGLYQHDEAEQNRAINESLFLENRKSTLQFSKTTKLKSRDYIFKRNGEIVHTAYRIPPTLVEEILNRTLTMECVFGGMIRKFQPGVVDGIYVAKDSKRRTINKTNWWVRGLRQVPIRDAIEQPWPTALPYGHSRLEDDYNEYYYPGSEFFNALEDDDLKFQLDFLYHERENTKYMIRQIEQKRLKKKVAG